MSLFEILLIILVCFLVIKPEDIPQILSKFQDIKAFVFSTKKEMISYFEPTNNDNISNFDSETDQINFYLEKISNLGFEYKGEYSLDAIKNYYREVINKQIKKELKMDQ